MNKEITFENSLDYIKVKPTRNDILKGMGYGNNAVPETITDIVDSLLSQAGEYTSIKGGFRIFPNGSVSIHPGTFKLQNVEFFTDKIIGKQLRKSTSITFLITTLGSKFDSWIKEYFNSGDPLSGYIADAIGSETVEKAADYFEELIVKETGKYKMGCTNRYSPGYCDWNVSEQHKLFSLLPANFCGIELSESALMNPIKSISAVIGIGVDCKKRNYQCSLCPINDCYKRNRTSEKIISQ